MGRNLEQEDDLNLSREADPLMTKCPPQCSKATVMELYLENSNTSHYMKQRIWTELPMFSRVTVKRIRIMTVQTGTTKKKENKEN